RFKFILYNKYNFNYKIIIDVIYIEKNKLILYVIDIATRFNTTIFLKGIKAKKAFKALRFY
ncbi:hypothetical protein V8F20_012858, partial [Naviculisporaceae sp. PSN 640]